MRYLGYKKIAPPDPSGSAEEWQGRKKAQSEAGYALLAEMVRAYFSPEVPPVCFAESGKPYFQGEGQPYFSLSHDGDLAVCVLDTEAPVGVDVCLVEPALSAGRHYHVFRRVYTEEEKAFVLAGDAPEEKDRRFYTLWSVKEAAVKKTGVGLFGLPPFCKEAPKAEGVQTLTLRQDGKEYIISIV